MTEWIYLPIFALIALIISLWLLTAYRRIHAVKNKQLNIKTVQNINHADMDEHILLPGRSYDNQFQQPMLFLILLLFLQLNQLDHILWQVGSWLFIVFRYCHCFEHLRAKNIRRRTLAFFLSSTTLWLLWLNFLYLNINSLTG